MGEKLATGNKRNPAFSLPSLTHLFNYFYYGNFISNIPGIQGKRMNSEDRKRFKALDDYFKSLKKESWQRMVRLTT